MIEKILTAVRKIEFPAMVITAYRCVNRAEILATRVYTVNGEVHSDTRKYLNLTEFDKAHRTKN